MFGFFSQLLSSVLVFVTLPVIQGAMLPWALLMTLTAATVAVSLIVYRTRAS